MSNIFSRVGVRFEVAQDVLGAIIAHHAEVLGEERSKANPDKTIIQKSLKAQEEMYEMRYRLRHDDEPEIERIIKEYGPIARELWDV